MKNLLSAATELNDAAAIAFCGAPLGKGRVFLHGFALGSFATALRFAGFGFAIERLRHGCGAADIAELQHFDVEFAAFIPHAQHVAYSHFAGRFRLDFVGADSTEITRLRRLGSRFEKTRGPEPFIDANRSCVLVSVHEILRRPLEGFLRSSPDV